VKYKNIFFLNFRNKTQQMRKQKAVFLGGFRRLQQN